MIERLSSGLGTTAIFIVVLSILVVAHELGHFLAARMVGVRVDVFSIGFGPRLFGWQWGATDYRFSLLPLGGYVRMAGDGPGSERTGAPDELESRGAWARLFIFGAGPAASIALAVLLLALAHVVGIEMPAYLAEPVRVEYVERGSSAEAAGVAPGDLVLAIDGRPVPDWEAFHEAVVLRPNAVALLNIDRGGQSLQLPVTIAATETHGIGRLGLHPCLSVELLSVTPGGAAAATDLRVGDIVLSVDGHEACNPDVLISLLQAGEGTPASFLVEREGQQLERSVEPRWNEAMQRWMIGVGPGASPRDVTLRRLPPWAALVASVERCHHDAGLVLATLSRLVTGRLSPRAMSGPLEIAAVTSQTAALGLVPLLRLMAFISLQLGLLNLLPIPLLDGGRMVLVAIEGLRGRDLAENTKLWILQAGLVMILSIMALVIYLDILKQVEN